MGWLFVGAMVLGWAGTLLMRQICFRLEILDVPNARSAHTAPMPTLGGVGLILGTCIALGLAHILDLPIPNFEMALLGASVVFLILIYDEVRALERLAKIAIQIVAALIIVLSGISITQVEWMGAVFPLGILSIPTTLIGLIAIQNLYNFMDGLDGFAGLEGLLVASLMTVLLWEISISLAALSLILSGATLGFWIWNKPPARIFMGDVGAHFLALCFGVLIIEGGSVGIPLYVMAMPLGAFLFDAVYTIIRRLLRGENITLAHRFHLYQRLNRMGWSAWRINMVYALCTLLLGSWAFGIQKNWVALGYCTGSLSVLMLAGGTLVVERYWARFEQAMP